ncbi:MAG: DUF4836 family protein [Bacteroidia bacterium]|nr:DUF4836 family protein [Bacteroidia bacterium]
MMLHTTPIILKKLLTSIVLFLSFQALFGQNLMNHVPKEAMFIAEFNLGKMDKKTSLDSLGALAFVQDFVRKAPAFIKNPGKFGIDTKQKAVLFYGTGETINYFSLLISVKDIEKMKSLSDATEGKFSLKSTGNYFEIEEKKYSYYGDSLDVVGAVNNNFLLLFGDMPSTDYMGIDPGESYQDRQKKAKIASKAKIAEIMALSGINSISTNSDFKTYYKKDGDIGLWMNSAIGLGSYKSMIRRNPMLKGFYQQIESMTKKSYNTGSIKLANGEMVLDFQSFGNEKMMEMVKDVSKARINKKFSRYVKQDDLMGYASFAANSYNAGKAYREYLTPLLDSFPQLPSGLGSSLFDILDIFIDEEAIAELVPGDMMFAFTGLKEYEREYTSYIYNDSTFEREEVIRTKKDMLPEFTFMLSTKREGDMRKILDALSRIPADRKGGEALFANEGLYYSIPTVKEKMGMDMMMAVQNGILFISNNADLIQNKLSTGYEKAEMIEKKHRKAMRKSNQVVYVDFQNIFSTVKKLPGKSMQDPKTQEMFDLMLANMDELWSRNYKRKDPFKSFVSLKMVDNGKNSLDQMANLVNDAFLATSRRAKKYQDEEMLMPEEDKD